MRSHRIWYLLLILIVFFFNVFFFQYLSYFAFWLVLILPLPVFILLLLTRRKITIELESSTPASGRGQEIPFSIVITNRGLLPLSCGKLKVSFDNRTTGEHFEKKLLFSAPAKSSSRVEWSSLAHHCGCVSVTVRRIRLLDLLGLFSLPMRAGQELLLLSMPYPTVLSEKSGTHEHGSRESSHFLNKAGNDPSETANIRSYYPGDSLRSIHWKLSSKLDNLMVREFSLPSAHIPLLLIELSKPEASSLTPFDSLFDTFTTFAAHFLTHRLPLVCMWFDRGHGMLQRRDIANEAEATRQMGHLLCSPSYPSDEPLALQALMAEAERPYSHIYYFTASLSSEALTLLSTNAALSHTTVLHCCSDDTPQQTPPILPAGVRLLPLYPGRLSDQLLSLEL